MSHKCDKPHKQKGSEEMSATEWRPIRLEYFGFNHWQVYRLLSVCATDRVGNREFKGGVFDSYEAAKKFADELNGVGGAGE
jgi:hypothetical protein